VSWCLRGKIDFVYNPLFSKKEDSRFCGFPLLSSH
jgi:hypothetical protein